MAHKQARGGKPERPASTNDGSENRTVPLLQRREYIKYGAVAVGALMTAGAVGDPVSGSSDEDFDATFDRVVNAVDDLGMDPSGSKPIDDKLNGAYEEGTLIQFPAGDYRVDSEMVIRGSTSRWGLQGLGENRDDVTFHFPNADNAYWFIHQHGGEDVLLDNFTLDSDNKLIAIRLRTNDNGLIRDVEWAGFLPERTERPGQLLDPGCRDVDGVNRVVRTVMGRDGSYVNGHSWATGHAGITGIRFYPSTDTNGEQHAGETILEDIEIHQIGSNGVRSTHPDGVVTVKGGFFKNCHLAHLRIHAGDHPSKRSSVTGATMIIDHDDHLPMGDGAWNEHGANAVMLDSTGHGYSQATYDSCDIICRNVEPTDGWGLIRCNNNGKSNPGGGVFRNCRIVNETELQTVWIDERESDASPPHNWLFENCEITVSAPDQYREAGLVFRDDWDGSTIRNCTIYAPEGDVDGVYIENCDDVTIEDTTIHVSGRATVFENADVSTSNISHEEPDDTDSSTDGTDDGGFEEEADSLRIIADDDADTFDYTFTVDGRVEHATDGDYPSNPDADVIVENDDGTYTVEGVVAGYDEDDKQWGGDSYWFDGEVVEFRLEGPATVLVNDEQVDATELVSGSDDDTEDDGTGDDGTEHLLRIIADDDADAFDYTFTVEGEIYYETDGDYPSNPDGDVIVDNGDGTYTVEGVVAGHTGGNKKWGGDTYRFIGDLISFSKEGPATILLNGDVIDPDEYTSQGERTLQIIADVDADAFDYTFTVDGEISHATDGDYPSNPDGDAIVKNVDGTYTVEGVVAGYDGDDTRWGGDTYRIVGSLVSMNIGGPADVYVDGAIVDPADYGLPERLAIVGTGTTSRYELTVDGELTSDPNGSDSDEVEISGSTAEGVVVDGATTLRFDGEITDFRFDGEAGVYLNGQQVDPALLGTDEDPNLMNWLVVQGSGNETDYQFEVSGTVRKSPDLGPVEADDVVDENVVDGTTVDETDGYRFSGDLESLMVRGNADLRFNDNL
ncbi:MAG: hypothetical protein ACOCQ3_02035 [Natronomonas sp.]